MVVGTGELVGVVEVAGYSTVDVVTGAQVVVVGTCEPVVQETFMVVSWWMYHCQTKSPP